MCIRDRIYRVEGCYIRFTQDELFDCAEYWHMREEEVLRILSLIHISPVKSGTCELVRDLFLFSVFTGLAYADVKALTTDRLQTFFDGHLWIILSLIHI